jgi:hypothetical protein
VPIECSSVRAFERSSDGRVRDAATDGAFDLAVLQDKQRYRRGRYRAGAALVRA